MLYSINLKNNAVITTKRLESKTYAMSLLGPGFTRNVNCDMLTLQNGIQNVCVAS